MIKATYRPAFKYKGCLVELMQYTDSRKKLSYGAYITDEYGDSITAHIMLGTSLNRWHRYINLAIEELSTADYEE